ncbi:deoxyribodipyrimidine photolyase [Owenweeksia hongkongensis DSM 17368]|uniref:Deoxyribodipyrimidine photolyase n=1 Tax=Owenweeksia hongkongensis (strain DSM 17368 / CIP 108786 / JCM 12287 / NRRL B-23963 / UST20020801) TaxID=926562 RepID=G8R787_OWEHD|nr:deoxyribodipyrimidine photo-lyase [Owenweeksia hongkongensis]AEV34494.1 deoxyribodipyrimidine photolyase [Owenweeksia hongkongensis DSM 17368]
MSEEKICIFWFRRDLRLNDNAGLYRALTSGLKVLPVFIFDTDILDELDDKKDARVHFIWQEVKSIKKTLEEKHGTSLLVKHGSPLKIFKDLVSEFPVAEVFTNRDYEPSAKERDKAVYEFLKSKDIVFKGFKDQVIFDKSEVMKEDGTPYEVFTPYMKKYKSQLKPFYLKSYPVKKYISNFYKCEPFDNISLSDLSFEKSNVEFPDRNFDKETIRSYHENRDFPAKKGTTRLSLHLRFGTISIRKLARLARKENDKFFNELIWRDFYQMILYHFPKSVNEAFKKKYDAIKWENNEEHFKKWCEGKTGYPLVDAGMRELNETDFMHNRVRMVVASFLTKHLLIDWRWGEAYFAVKLLDYDQASNIGGWQWAAGCGVDAAPYFRVFNPELQLKKFDPENEYVKKWVPEWSTPEYPEPIVEHKFARERALSRYKEALS